MKSFFVWGREGSRGPADQAISLGLASKPNLANHLKSWWITALGLIAVLAVSACVSKPVAIPSGLTHPADPAALQAPLPSKSATLTSETVKAPPPPSMGGGHHMHRMSH